MTVIPVDTTVKHIDVVAPKAATPAPKADAVVAKAEKSETSKETKTEVSK